MSQAHDLGASAFATAQGFLTGSSADHLSIAGGDLLCVIRNEESTDRNYEVGGQQISVDLLAVAKSQEFNDLYPADPQTYLGKTAILNGDFTYSVEVIRRGEVFTEIGLVGGEEAP